MMKKKICFVSPYAYSLFKPSTRYLFGGSEIRCWLLANGIASYPYFDVSVIVFDHGQPKVEKYGNVKLYAHSYYQSPVKNSFADRIKKKLTEGFDRLFKSPIYINEYEILSNRIQVYKDVDADIYCEFGVGNFTAELAAYCKRYNKKLVLFVGCDLDLSDKYYEGSREINEYGSLGHLCNYAIHNSGLIIAQTERQKDLLKRRFGKESTKIRNPVDPNNKNNEMPVKSRRKAIWVGKSDSVKRPEIMVELARAHSDVEFVMVMNKSNHEVHLNLLNNLPSNIRLYEYMPYNEIERLFAEARVLVNTSKFEGFPNTFLQAGKYGTPILSLMVDPDDFIRQNECGIVAGGDSEMLKNGLNTIFNDDVKTQKYSNNIRKYILDNHGLDEKVCQFKDVLNSVNS